MSSGRLAEANFVSSLSKPAKKDVMRLSTDQTFVIKEYKYLEVLFAVHDGMKSHIGTVMIGEKEKFKQSQQDRKSRQQILPSQKRFHSMILYQKCCEQNHSRRIKVV